MIEWVEDQDNVITKDDFEQRLGPLGAEPVDENSRMEGANPRFALRSDKK